ncbi:MAG: cytochrome c biogenesis protein ResB [Thermodesulfobacteriota bacterium]
MKNTNAFWEFFSSVKLAIFTFITLAVTSIIGTVIPQNEPISFYVQEFGPKMATIFKYLHVPDMYNSWWFLSLLVLFSINLLVCSLDRIPNVIRILKTNNLETDIGRLTKQRERHELPLSLPLAAAGEQVKGAMAASGWKTSSAERDGGILFFAEKGGWTRFGVYSVHLSILVIFVGAIIGSVFGYKASVMVPEGSSTKDVYARDSNHTPIPLGFDLRCDRFDLHYFDNGMPKDYISYLTVRKDGKIVLQKRVEVNDPLQYAGLTFYQSSYQAIENQYVVFLQKVESGESGNFIVAPRREMKWQEQNVTFGIVDMRNPNMFGQYQHKIWFSDGKGSPVEFWVDEARPADIKRDGVTFRFELKQRFATGLQVAKDPGVWWVYAGCTLMLVGLWVVFFLSHRRVWVWLVAGGEGTTAIVSGNANKNKVAFEKDLEKFADLIRSRVGKQAGQ